MQTTSLVARAFHVLVPVALLAFSAPDLHAANGRAVISGKQKLRFKQCGRSKADPAIDLQLFDAGQWTISFDTVSLSGSYVEAGRTGRKLQLTPDGASTTALVTYLQGQLGVLCGAPTTGVAAVPKTLLAKVNRRQTKATLKLAYRLEGVQTGSFKLRGKGSLGPLPTTTTSTIGTTTSTIGTTTTSTIIGTTTSTIIGTTTTSTIGTTTSTIIGTTTTSTIIGTTTTSTIIGTTTSTSSTSTSSTSTSSTTTSTVPQGHWGTMIWGTDQWTQ